MCIAPTVYNFICVWAYLSLTRMLRKYYDADVDWSRIADKTVAVIGYGSQGRAQAANLRDNGLAVIVGVRPGRSFEAASLEGFTTMPVADAVRKADVLAMLVPDESAAEIFRRDMLPWLHDGQTIVFAHGFNIHYGQIVPPPNVDVVMVAPKGVGPQVRRLFLEDSGVASLIAVYQDVTGSAKQIQVTMPENTVLGANETLNTYIVVPAGEYGTTDKVTLYIYTTDGVVTAPLDAKHENSSTSGSGSQQFNVTNDVAFEDIYPYTVEGKYFVCNVGFDNLAVEKPGETTISSTEDLDTYLSWFKNTSGTGGVELTINTLGDDVELSKAAYDILNGNKLIKATFKGNLTLAEGVGENVLDLIKIDATAARTLTNKADINVPATLDAQVTLVNEGTITLSAVANAYVNKFENKGTMNITAPNAQSTVQLTLNSNTTDFVNSGELNISGNMTLTSNYGIMNNGEVNILSGTTNGKIANGFSVNNDQISYTAGVINVADMFGIKSIRTKKRLDIVVTLAPLEEMTEIDRLGNNTKTIEIMGVRLPHLILPVSAGRDTGRLVEVAAFQTKLRVSGHPSGTEQYNKRIKEKMERERKMKMEGKLPIWNKLSPGKCLE